jgi:hypothetical protein
MEEGQARWSAGLSRSHNWVNDAANDTGPRPQGLTRLGLNSEARPPATASSQQLLMLYSDKLSVCELLTGLLPTNFSARCGRRCRGSRRDWQPELMSDRRYRP